MLLSYAFSNFGSFAERAEVSFVLTQRDLAEGWVRESRSGRRVSTGMAVLGANGAGKSTVLRASSFLAWFMSDSFELKPDAPLPFHTHRTLKDAPSEFLVVYEDRDGAEWTYELKVRLDRVEYEALTRRANEPGARGTKIFTRHAEGDSYVVSQSFDLASSEAAKVRGNVSLIAWAKQYGSELAQKIARISLATNFDEWGRHSSPAWQFEAAGYFEKHAVHRDAMRDLMKRWDFGLADVRLQSLPARPSASGGSGEPEWMPIGVHQAAGGVFELPFWSESSGTQQAFFLLRKLLPVLEIGGLALIDEFESDLHPHMIEPMLRLFHDERTNPHGAQIVFTCHSPEVLRTFHRAQVTFVEKTDCLSEAYRGDAIEGLTNQHNLYNKYLSGALGAVPQV